MYLRLNGIDMTVVILKQVSFFASMGNLIRNL